MTKVNDVDSDRYQQLSDEMEMRLGELVTSFSDKHGLSGLSSTTLAVQMLTAGLLQLGGPAAQPYIQCAIDMMSCRNQLEANKINQRARRAMLKMADHFDEQKRAFAARKLQ